MFDERVSRILVLFFRLSSLSAKFFLMFFAAKILSVSDFASYIILVAIVSYSSYLIGLDYYSYSNRIIVGSNQGEMELQVKNQFSLYIFMYLLLFTLLLINNEMSYYNVGVGFALLFVIMVLEHILLELSRILNIKKEFLSSAFLLFSRSVPWVVAFLLYSLYKEQASIDSLAAFWAVGLAISFGLSIVFIKRILCLKSVILNPVNKQVILTGLKVSFVLFLGTLSLRGFFSLDKIILDTFASAKYIAIYGFSWGLANGVLALVDSGFIVFKYPLIIESVKERQFLKTLNISKELLFSITSIFAIYITLVTFFADNILYFIFDFKTSNINSSIVMGGVAVAAMAYSLSLIPHYIIYSFGTRDYMITAISVCSLSIFLIFVFFNYDVNNALVYGLCLGMFTNLLLKCSLAVKMFVFEKERLNA